MEKLRNRFEIADVFTLLENNMLEPIKNYI